MNVHECNTMKKEYNIKPFKKMLKSNNLSLERDKTTCLQVNVGLICNQKCRHCHLEAGPNRKEIMSTDTMDHVIKYAENNHFSVIDVTGGAPELVPNIEHLIENLALLTPRLIFRSNLSVLGLSDRKDLIELLKKHNAVIIASFPSINETQSDSQRGEGIFQRSINTLKRLNEMGYGRENSGLELDLVSNPTGAFLPQSQERTEKRFRKILKEKWGIHFHNLYSFANVPLGRFRNWLTKSGNYDIYMDKLVASFNPCSIEGLMCRTTVSVSWDGYLYDCDFNLAAGIFMGGRKTNISDIIELPKEGQPIYVSDYCYTCTAGSGFT